MTSNKLENLLHLVGWFSWAVSYRCFLYRAQKNSMPKLCEVTAGDHNKDLLSRDYTSEMRHFIAVKLGLTGIRNLRPKYPPSTLLRITSAYAVSLLRATQIWVYLSLTLQNSCEFGITIRNMWSFARWNNQGWDNISQSRQREVDFWSFLKPFTLQQTHSCTTANSHTTVNYLQYTKIITKNPVHHSYNPLINHIRFLSIRHHLPCTKCSVTS